MQREEIIQKIREIIRDNLKLDCAPEEIKGTDLIAELGINSVDALEILVWVETVFDITIEDDDLNIDIMETLDHLADYIQRKMNE